ncbi:MAG TPA: retropepsin-like aspartic protease, partial [Aggregicoccus sp.]|nr:retropepsin-like aspartic protease [Aggregicoccus sp.]
MKSLPKLLLLLALVLVPGAARADALAELLERHLAWRGGEAYARVQRVHLRAATATWGLKGTLESWSLRDGRSRLDRDLGVLRSSQAFLPQGSWSVNASGQVEDAAPGEVRDAQRRSALDFGEALRGRAGAKLALLADEPRDGRSWKVVRATFGDEDHYDLFLDGATGALHGLRIREDGRTRFVRLGDWRLVKGVRLPFLEEVFTDHPDGDSRTEVQALTLDAPLPASLFARPSGARRASFARGRRSTGFLPFEFFAENRVYIPAKVNGRSTQVLLDSGAEMTVVDEAYARELGLKVEAKLPAVGAGGMAEARLAGGVDIVLGDLRLQGLTVVVIDLQAVAQAIGHPLPVILGKEAFNQLIVDVDFPNRRVAFHEPGHVRVPARAVRVPLREGAGRMREVQVSIEGRPPIPVLFDV